MKACCRWRSSSRSDKLTSIRARPLSKSRDWWKLDGGDECLWPCWRAHLDFPKQDKRHDDLSPLLIAPVERWQGEDKINFTHPPGVGKFSENWWTPTMKTTSNGVKGQFWDIPLKSSTDFALLPQQPFKRSSCVCPSAQRKREWSWQDPTGSCTWFRVIVRRETLWWGCVAVCGERLLVVWYGCTTQLSIRGGLRWNRSEMIRAL